MAEQLAFEECLDDGGTVQHDEFALHSAAAMQRPRHQVFPHTSRALDQHGAIVRRDSLNHSQQFPHD